MWPFARQARSEARLEPVLAPVETRAASRYSDGWGAAAIGSGVGFGGQRPMPSYLAESHAAVQGAIGLITSSISSLPAFLTIDSPDGRQPAPPSASGWRILQRPNARQSWPALASWLAAEVLLQGNAVCRIETDGRGAVVGLVPVPWQWLNPVIVNAASGRARLVYDVVHHTPESALLNLPDRLLEGDVLHIRGRSDSGVIGRSVLSRAGGPVHEGLDLAGAAQRLWANGLHPGGFMSTGGAVLTDQQRERFKARLDDLPGVGNAGKTMLLEGQFSYSASSVPPADAELLASRRFSVAEICRLFGIPEPMLQLGQSAPASLDPYIVAFAQLALAPLVNAIEAEFDHAVLPPGLHLQIDLAGLMRGSYSGMTAALCSAVQSGVMSPNDGRRALGLPPLEGGDALRPGNAPNWPADAKGLPHLGPSPGPTGAGLPDAGSHQNDGAG